MVSRTEGNIDDSLIGGNASTEGPEAKRMESAVITVVEIYCKQLLSENHLHKRSLQEVHQRLHEINQRQTSRKCNDGGCRTDQARPC